MARFVILTSRKRAIIALVHTVFFLLLAVLTGLAVVRPLHRGAPPSAWIIATIYVIVSGVLLVLTVLSGRGSERFYFGLCTGAAVFGLLRQLLGDEQMHVAVYIRVLMLACAVLIGFMILNRHSRPMAASAEAGQEQ
ncbi:MAG TPA: hypothetical protein VFR84_17675 [Candidatus Angelobacter sp.]|nr:hypothetical protein [Candidatus Angelobacter sp.]